MIIITYNRLWCTVRRPILCVRHDDIIIIIIVSIIIMIITIEIMIMIMIMTMIIIVIIIIIVVVIIIIRDHEENTTIQALIIWDMLNALHANSIINFIFFR